MSDLIHIYVLTYKDGEVCCILGESGKACRQSLLREARVAIDYSNNLGDDDVLRRFQAEFLDSLYCQVGYIVKEV